MEQRDHPSILIQYFKAMISHPQVSPVWPGSSKTNPQQISLSRAQLELSAGITEEVAVSQQTVWSGLLSRLPLKGALICDTPLQFKLSCEPSRVARHISVETLQKIIQRYQEQPDTRPSRKRANDAYRIQWPPEKPSPTVKSVKLVL